MSWNHETLIAHIAELLQNQNCRGSSSYGLIIVNKKLLIRPKNLIAKTKTIHVSFSERQLTKGCTAKKWDSVGEIAAKLYAQNEFTMPDQKKEIQTHD